MDATLVFAVSVTFGFFTYVIAEKVCSGVSVCTCNENNTLIDCKGKHLLSVPELLPGSVETLHLERNDFTNISSGAFKRWPLTRKLWLDHNKISQIEPFAFTGLDSLIYLDLRSNQIKIVGTNSFAGLPNLEELFLTTNKIHSVEQNAFEGTESLKFISFQANKLLEVPSIGYQPGLNYLILEGNRIINATVPEPYKGSSNISSLVLSNNKIVALEKQTFQAFAGAFLNDLKLARNKIQSIDPGSLECFKSIKELKIGDNSFIRLQEVNHLIQGLQNKQLQILDISALALGNEISEDTFYGFHDVHIKTLIMRRNGIIILRDDAFKRLEHLTELDLSANEITVVSDKAFAKLGKLTTLKLSVNRISSIPKQLPSSLQVLFLDKNLIAKIDAYAFQNLPHLQELRLNFNSILTLVKDSFHGLYNLKTLDLTSNNINTLPGKVFEQFVRLKHLNLAKNKLTTIQKSDDRFAAMHSLEYLSLADNQCSVLQKDLFQPLLNLKYLHLEENELGGLISEDKEGELFLGLDKLQEVHLMKNNITVIPGNLFKDQVTLKVLNISHNDVNRVGPELVNLSKTDNKLDLSYNHITSLYVEDLHFLNDKTVLNLMGNPFVCDCNVRGFLKWKNTSHVLLPDFNSYICNGPNEWAGKPLVDFSKTDINCTFYTKYAICGSLVAALSISLLVYYLLYSKRWTIRLCRYRMKKCLELFLRRAITSLFGAEGQLAPEGRFDAYVSISEHDKEWAVKHLLPGIDNGQLDDDNPFRGQFKLYYEDRDGMPGMAKCVNVKSFLVKSKKVIVVLSENYMQPPTMYENSMELERATVMLHERDIEDIIVILLGDVPAEKVPDELYMQMKKERFLQWEEQPEAIEHFKIALIDRLQAKPQD